MIYKKIVKRLLDIIASGAGLVLLSPLLFIIWILVRVKLGKPAIFSQRRPGLDERIFTLFKFRTMTDERDEKGELLPDEKRLTAFGSLLRRTSLDELPELFNIFKGDMSVVGPRPLLEGYLPYYRGRERKRHSVRPGLTGLAQVNGRNFLSWDKRLSLDADYVENLSFLMDLKIIIKTVMVVFKRDGVSEDSNQVESYLWEERS